MNYLNHLLFVWLNALEYPRTALLSSLTFVLEHVVWIISALIGIGVLRDVRTRKILLETIASGLAGLFIHQNIRLISQQLPSAVAEIGHTLLSPASAVPSSGEYLTLLWTIFFSFLIRHRPRLTGIVLALLGLPVAWARLHFGVHFPLGLLGAVLMVWLSAWLIFREARFQELVACRSGSLIANPSRVEAGTNLWFG